MVDMVYRLLREDGWFFGSSSGINLGAAVKAAKTLGPGHTIVTILCDDGGKYQSRLYNDEVPCGKRPNKSKLTKTGPILPKFREANARSKRTLLTVLCRHQQGSD